MAGLNADVRSLTAVALMVLLALSMFAVDWSAHKDNLRNLDSTVSLQSA
jgi:hypothetical protein